MIFISLGGFQKKLSALCLALLALNFITPNQSNLWAADCPSGKKSWTKLLTKLFTNPHPPQHLDRSEQIVLERVSDALFDHMHGRGIKTEPAMQAELKRLRNLTDDEMKSAENQEIASRIKVGFRVEMIRLEDDIFAYKQKDEHEKNMVKASEQIQGYDKSEPNIILKRMGEDSFGYLLDSIHAHHASDSTLKKEEFIKGISKAKNLDDFKVLEKNLEKPFSWRRYYSDEQQLVALLKQTFFDQMADAKTVIGQTTNKKDMIDNILFLLDSKPSFVEATEKVIVRAFRENSAYQKTAQNIIHEITENSNITTSSYNDIKFFHSFIYLPKVSQELYFKAETIDQFYDVEKALQESFKNYGERLVFQIGLRELLLKKIDEGKISGSDEDKAISLLLDQNFMENVWKVYTHNTDSREIEPTPFARTIFSRVLNSKVDTDKILDYIGKYSSENKIATTNHVKSVLRILYGDVANLHKFFSYSILIDNKISDHVLDKVYTRLYLFPNFSTDYPGLAKDQARKILLRPGSVGLWEHAIRENKPGFPIVDFFKYHFKTSEQRLQKLKLLTDPKYSVDAQNIIKNFFDEPLDDNFLSALKSQHAKNVPSSFWLQNGYVNDIKEFMNLHEKWPSTGADSKDKHFWDKFLKLKPSLSEVFKVYDSERYPPALEKTYITDFFKPYFIKNEFQIKSLEEANQLFHMTGVELLSKIKDFDLILPDTKSAIRHIEILTQVIDKKTGVDSPDITLKYLTENIYPVFFSRKPSVEEVFRVLRFSINDTGLFTERYMELASDYLSKINPETKDYLEEAKKLNFPRTGITIKQIQNEALLFSFLLPGYKYLDEVMSFANYLRTNPTLGDGFSKLYTQLLQRLTFGLKQKQNAKTLIAYLGPDELHGPGKTMAARRKQLGVEVERQFSLYKNNYADLLKSPDYVQNNLLTSLVHTNEERMVLLATANLIHKNDKGIRWDKFLVDYCYERLDLNEIKYHFSDIDNVTKPDSIKAEAVIKTDIILLEPKSVVDITKTVATKMRVSEIPVQPQSRPQTKVELLQPVTPPQVIRELSLSQKPIESSDENSKTRKPIILEGPVLEIEEKIGFGAFADVYRGRLGSQPLAIKIYLNPEVTEAARDSVEQMRRISRAARNDEERSYNVQVLYDDFTKSTPLVGLELVDGKNLRQVLDAKAKDLKEKYLDLNLAVSVAKQVAKGVRVAHRVNVVHKDLKPDNILVSKDGHVKVTDYGGGGLSDDPKKSRMMLSTALKSEVDSGDARTDKATINTLYYPKKSREPNRSDPRQDIFAIGTILHELITGEVPEGRVQLENEFIHFRKDDYDRLSPEAKAKFNQVLAKTLGHVERERYQKIDELVSDLEVLEKLLPKSGSDSLASSLGKIVSETPEDFKDAKIEEDSTVKTWRVDRGPTQTEVGQKSEIIQPKVEKLRLKRFDPKRISEKPPIPIREKQPYTTPRKPIDSVPEMSTPVKEALPPRRPIDDMPTNTKPVIEKPRLQLESE